MSFLCLLLFPIIAFGHALQSQVATETLGSSFSGIGEMTPNYGSSLPSIITPSLPKGFKKLLFYSRLGDKKIETLGYVGSTNREFSDLIYFISKRRPNSGYHPNLASYEVSGKVIAIRTNALGSKSIADIHSIQGKSADTYRMILTVGSDELLSPAVANVGAISFPVSKGKVASQWGEVELALLSSRVKRGVVDVKLHFSAKRLPNGQLVKAISLREIRLNTTPDTVKNLNSFHVVDGEVQKDNFHAQYCGSGYALSFNVQYLGEQREIGRGIVPVDNFTAQALEQAHTARKTLSGKLYSIAVDSGFVCMMFQADR